MPDQSQSSSPNYTAIARRRRSLRRGPGASSAGPAVDLPSPAFPFPASSTPWAFNRAGTHGIDSYAARRVFERRAACQANHAMLGAVIGRNQRPPGEPADGRAVDDRAAALLAHLHEFVLHACSVAALVDSTDAVIVLCGLIPDLRHRRGSSPCSADSWAQSRSTLTTQGLLQNQFRDVAGTKLTT